MSLLIQAQTSDDDEEIMGCLDFVLRSAKLGLIHESIDVNSLGSYTSKQPLHSLPLLTLTLPRKLVCMGERRICRDDS